jgi:CRISPR-associated protein Csd1
LRRIRAERGDVNCARASVLKACINRRIRLLKLSQGKEITVALDPDDVNQGYRLGRLFAVLEKIQEDANPGINATIRDRFYGAASSTPVSAFPQLLKLKNHHLSKLDNPAFRVTHEKRLAEIMGGLGSSMPSHLSMDDQARFALGYYHQRQALFTSNKDSRESK